jgi:hypothetical protein
MGGAIALLAIGLTTIWAEETTLPPDDGQVRPAAPNLTLPSTLPSPRGSFGPRFNGRYLPQDQQDEAAARPAASTPSLPGPVETSVETPPQMLPLVKAAESSSESAPLELLPPDEPSAPRNSVRDPGHTDRMPTGITLPPPRPIWEPKRPPEPAKRPLSSEGREFPRLPELQRRSTPKSDEPGSQAERSKEGQTDRPAPLAPLWKRLRPASDQQAAAGQSQESQPRGNIFDSWRAQQGSAPSEGDLNADSPKKDESTARPLFRRPADRRPANRPLLFSRPDSQ